MTARHRPFAAATTLVALVATIAALLLASPTSALALDDPAIPAVGASGYVPGVYRGAAPAAPPRVTAYEQWAGHSTPVVLDFTAEDSWDSVSGPGWQLAPWRDSGRRVIYTISVLPRFLNGTGSLATCADGGYDAIWRRLGLNLVAYGLPTTILRPAHEFNGTWFPWAAKGKEASYAACFRRLVSTMRAVPDQQFAFMWSPNVGPNAFPAENAWPGDDYVDYVGLSAYDHSWVTGSFPYPPNATPEQRLASQQRAWNELYGGNHGLRFWRDYSIAHGKRLTFPEWGLITRPDGHGGGDDPYYIEQMYRFFTDPANNVAFSSYFDFDNENIHSISRSDTPYVQGAATYKQLFGGLQIVADPRVTTPIPMPVLSTVSPRTGVIVAPGTRVRLVGRGCVARPTSAPDVIVYQKLAGQSRYSRLLGGAMCRADGSWSYRRVVSRTSYFYAAAVNNSTAALRVSVRR